MLGLWWLNSDIGRAATNHGKTKTNHKSFVHGLICLAFSRAMEKQIFKSCTFTLSGPSGVGIGNSWGGGYFTIRYLVQLILWMLQLYYERTLILTIALLILLVHLQVNKNLHIYYAASS